MLFSKRDFDILQLLRWCRYIGAPSLVQAFSEEEIHNLQALSLIKFYKPGNAFVLTTKGNRLLDSALHGLPPATPPAYREPDTTRRIRSSEIMLTAYQAGLDVFAKDPSDLAEDQTMFLPSISRGRGTNPWGSTRVAAIAHLGDLLGAFHYVCPEIGRLALNDELAAFYNNTALLSNMQRVIIFSGPNYKAILAELERTDAVCDSKLTSYGDAYRLLKLPVFLIPCNAIGVLQLQVLSIPNYRQQLTHALLRSKYISPPDSFPWCDAFFKDAPFIMAVDMDLRRIEAALVSAEEQGFHQIGIAALLPQAKAILNHLYPDTRRVEFYQLKEDLLLQILDAPFPSVSEPHEAFRTQKGDVVCVPSIKTR